MLELLECEPKGKNAFEFAAGQGPRQTRLTDGRDFRSVSRKRRLERLEWRRPASGLGLAPATLEPLFRAFDTAKPNGLGLGQSICRLIVEAHGGRLRASANS